MQNPPSTLPILLFLGLFLGLPLAAGAEEAPPSAVPEPPAAAEPTPVDPNPADASPVDLSPTTVNAVAFTGAPIVEGRGALVLKLQVLLDRAGFSPGVIDGVMGGNVAKAIFAAEAFTGLPQDGVLDADLWQRLAPVDQTAVMVGYEITSEDIDGPYVPDLPTDYGELAKLDRAAYRDPAEMLAERFHMDQDLLIALNPGVDFSAAGTVINVTDPGAPKTGVKVTNIVADKDRAQVLGYDAENRLVVSYPATIGSTALPSPSGMHLVKAIAPRAAYYYRPEVNFQQGDNSERLTLPPGPNNPIGTTWIDLSEPTYGIHGTPEPSRIDKTNSHGCVRLTNWDVEELAGLIEKGVPVEFR